MSERSTGATDEQIEAAVDRCLADNSWLVAHRTLAVKLIRLDASYLVPPDTRIVPVSPVRVDREALMEAESCLTVTLNALFGEYVGVRDSVEGDSHEIQDVTIQDVWRAYDAWMKERSALRATPEPKTPEERIDALETQVAELVAMVARLEVARLEGTRVMDERIMQNTVALGIIKAAARFPFIAQSADTDCYTVLADAAIAELRADGYAIVPASPVADPALVEAIYAGQKAIERFVLQDSPRWHSNPDMIAANKAASAAWNRIIDAMVRATPEPERAE